jgi:hypothetical protein
MAVGARATTNVESFKVKVKHERVMDREVSAQQVGGLCVSRSSTARTSGRLGSIRSDSAPVVFRITWSGQDHIGQNLDS